jgi:PhnB protein
MSIRGARPNSGQIAPHLIVRDAEAAIDFYRRAFGAEELYRSPMPSGIGVHAQLRIGDSVVMVSSENLIHDPDLCSRAPETLGGSSSILELYVDDVDAAYKRAIDSGASPTIPLADTFFGDRYGQLRDPSGHVWALATVKEELTPEQIAERMGNMGR